MHLGNSVAEKNVKVTLHRLQFDRLERGYTARRNVFSVVLQVSGS